MRRIIIFFVVAVIGWAGGHCFAQDSEEDKVYMAVSTMPSFPEVMVN